MKGSSSYGVEHFGWTPRISQESYGVRLWRHICEGCSTFFDLVEFEVGSGSTIFDLVKFKVGSGSSITF